MLELLARYKNRFCHLDDTYKFVIFGMLLVTIFAILFDFNSNTTTATNALKDDSTDSSLNTFIPDGFTLVPIEILNSSGMDSILGRFGMADLYKEGQNSAFMQNVRLVRGIESEGPWAALVPAQYAAALLQAGARFYVVVKNRKTAQTHYQAPQSTRKHQIIYEGD